MNEIDAITTSLRMYDNGYNQALEDVKKYILNSCNDVTCREDINADNDFDFYASELLDMLKEMKK